VKPNAIHSVELSGHDLMMLRAGLKAYLQAFEQHRQADEGVTHPDDEWRRLQRQVGHLLWRLEEAGVETGTTVVHSDEAVDPGG
jgi:hypothetical protein